MNNSTFYKTLHLFIKQLFCLVLIFNVMGKTVVVEFLHDSFDYFELCDSASEEKEMDEKEIEDYDEEKKFFVDISLHLKHTEDHMDYHFYKDSSYLNLHSSIVLPPPEELA